MSFVTDISVGDILQIILTIAGIYIAYMEFRRDLKDKEETKTRRTKINEIVTKIDNLNKLPNKYEEFCEKIIPLHDQLKPLQQDNQSLELAVIMINSYKNEFSKLSEFEYLDSIDKLYNLLLRYEDHFSMSYGYDRYIESFGDFFEANDEIKETRKKIDSFIKRCDPQKPETFPRPDEMMSFLNYCKAVADFYLSKLKRVVRSIEELKKKYEKVDEQYYHNWN